MIPAALATHTGSEPGIAIATHAKRREANTPPLFVLHWCSVVTQPCISTLDQTQRPQSKYLIVTQCCVSSHNTCASISSSLYSDIPYLWAVENTVTQQSAPFPAPSISLV